MAAKKRWFDVTITESYHATYKVKAADRQEAENLANEAVDCGRVDPTNDGADSYARTVYADEGCDPEEIDIVITK